MHIKAVTGLLFNDSGEVLTGQRPLHKELGGYWEFPGGKREASESSYQTLVREWREEIGIGIESARRLRSFWVHYDSPVRYFDIWFITQYQGAAQAMEGQVIAWQHPHTLKRENFPQANHLLVDMIIKEGASLGFYPVI